MKKILDIILQIIWIILQLPQIIIALFMMPFLGKMSLIRRENYCWVFKCEKMAGGISLGCFIFLSPVSARREATIRHELGHVKQSHRLLWLYLFVIGIPSIFRAMLHKKNQCYYSFYTESWANKLAGLLVGGHDEFCYTYIPQD